MLETGLQAHRVTPAPAITTSTKEDVLKSRTKIFIVSAPALMLLHCAALAPAALETWAENEVEAPSAGTDVLPAEQGKESLGPPGSAPGYVSSVEAPTEETPSAPDAVSDDPPAVPRPSEVAEVEADAHDQVAPATPEPQSPEAATSPAEEAPAPPAEEEPDGGFAAWLIGFKVRALALGISEETLRALDGISPIARVIELDRRQPERRFTFQQYMERVIPDSRVEEGRRRFSEHKELLDRIGEKYGVQPRFLVALWGIETDYGRNTGGFRVLDSLATLAHEGRRAAFFETELINALRIIDAGHISPDLMIGSWAGALGQCQFMPSSFLSYAVDFTGDGKRDIWTSLPDVFASSANYLATHGWQAGQTWGRQVRLPNDFSQELVGLDTLKPLEDWQSLGVRRENGSDLPAAEFNASLVQPGGPSGPTYLVYENYRTIMRWNRSHYFATAVGLLADRIGAP